MLNTVILQGRLTADPEIRYTKDNKAVMSFRLAVQRDGEGTDFISCSAWGKTAEFIGQYLRKGMMMLFSGKMRSRDWTDKDGKKHNTQEPVADHVWFGEAKKREPEGTQDDGAFRDPFEEEYGDPGDLPF